MGDIFKTEFEEEFMRNQLEGILEMNEHNVDEFEVRGVYKAALVLLLYHTVTSSHKEALDRFGWGVLPDEEVLQIADQAS